MIGCHENNRAVDSDYFLAHLLIPSMVLGTGMIATEAL